MDIACLEGLTIDLLAEMSKTLGFTYDMYLPKDGQWGSFLDGEYNGIIRHLQDKVGSSQPSKRQGTVQLSFRRATSASPP